MSRWLLSVLLLGVVVAAVMAHPRGRGGWGRRGGPWGRHGPGRFDFGGRRSDPSDVDHEKAFFCQAAKKACYVEATANGTVLVDRGCIDGTPCEEGDTGVITLGGSEYEVTFCPPQAPDANPLLVMINKERKEEPSDALQAICPLPDRTDSHYRSRRSRVPFWYHLACKVATPSGEQVKQERGCYGNYTCSQGPYSASYENQDVRATFCNYPQRKTRRQKSPEDEEQKSFWYKSACQVADNQGTVLEQDDCPRNQTCSVRLTDMTDDNLDVFFCDGLPLGEPSHSKRGSKRRYHRW